MVEIDEMSVFYDRPLHSMMIVVGDGALIMFSPLNGDFFPMLGLVFECFFHYSHFDITTQTYIIGCVVVSLFESVSSTWRPSLLNGVDEGPMMEFQK